MLPFFYPSFRLGGRSAAWTNRTLSSLSFSSFNSSHGIFRSRYICRYFFTVFFDSPHAWAIDRRLRPLSYSLRTVLSLFISIGLFAICCCIFSAEDSFNQPFY